MNSIFFFKIDVDSSIQLSGKQMIRSKAVCRYILDNMDELCKGYDVEIHLFNDKIEYMKFDIPKEHWNIIEKYVRKS